MGKTLGEIRDLEYKEIEERRRKRNDELERELKKQLKTALGNEEIEVLSMRDLGDDYMVEIAFTLDCYRQVDNFYWNDNESKEKFIENTKRRIEYIKELRKQYPSYCKQNDYIQTNRDFSKKIVLTHMGYKREFELNLELADYLKLPNTTDTGFGGGDYEIKRTPKRVKEYNENIDIVIDALIDCIAELKQKKCIINS